MAGQFAARSSVRAFALSTASAVGLISVAEAQSSDEIVVTATRRAESINDVPVSVSAFDERLIEYARVTDIRALQTLSPSFASASGQSGAGATFLSIRGVGTSGDNAGFESAVGVFIDGVYRSRSGIGIAELPEVAQVELLRGPQGTLFGKNTSGGAISITTAGPQDDFAGYASAIFGNFDQIEIEAGLTGPVVADTLALRVDGKYREREGHIRDVNSDRTFNDLDRYFVRGQALFAPYETFRMRLIADLYRADENCCAGVNFIAGPTADTVDLIASFSALTGLVREATEAFQVAYTPGRDLTENVDEWGASNEIDWEIGGLNLTAITAYRDFELVRGQDIDFSGLDRAYREGQFTGFETFTQELRLQGERGALDWLVGAFFAKEDLAFTDTVRFGAQNVAYVDALFAFNPLAGFELYDTFGAAVPEAFGFPLPAPVAGDGQQADAYTIATTSWALFTHNEISLSDRLTLTAGARLNRERKTFSATLDAVSPTCDFYLSVLADPGFQAFATAAPEAVLLSCNPAVNTEFNGAYADRRTETEVTGTAKLAWRLTDSLLAYGGYDRGYKAGGFNLDRSGFDTVILGGDGAQTNDLEFEEEVVNAYEIGVKTDWLDGALAINAALFLQNVADFQNLVFSGTNFFVVNADIRARGVELESRYRPTDALTMQAGYTLLDAEFTDAAQLAGTALAGLEGSQLAGTPRHVLTGAVTYAPPIGATGLDGLLHVNVRWQSKASLDALAAAGNEAFAVFGGRIGVSGGKGRWLAEAFAENIFDKRYFAGAFGVPEQPGTVAVYPAPPRFWGGRVRVHF
ncbi:MAG: TonB-dependent receptor [Parvularculaceae bacterium]